MNVFLCESQEERDTCCYAEEEEEEEERLESSEGRTGSKVTGREVGRQRERNYFLYSTRQTSLWKHESRNSMNIPRVTSQSRLTATSTLTHMLEQSY